MHCGAGKWEGRPGSPVPHLIPLSPPMVPGVGRRGAGKSLQKGPGEPAGLRCWRGPPQAVGSGLLAPRSVLHVCRHARALSMSRPTRCHAVGGLFQSPSRHRTERSARAPALRATARVHSVYIERICCGVTTVGTLRGHCIGLQERGRGWGPDSLAPRNAGKARRQEGLLPLLCLCEGGGNTPATRPAGLRGAPVRQQF